MMPMDSDSHADFTRRLRQDAQRWGPDPDCAFRARLARAVDAAQPAVPASARVWLPFAAAALITAGIVTVLAVSSNSGRPSDTGRVVASSADVAATTVAESGGHSWPTATPTPTSPATSPATSIATSIATPSAAPGAVGTAPFSAVFQVDSEAWRSRVADSVGKPFREEVRRLGDDAARLAGLAMERVSGPLQLLGRLHAAVADLPN